MSRPALVILGIVVLSLCLLAFLCLLIAFACGLALYRQGGGDGPSLFFPAPTPEVLRPGVEGGVSFPVSRETLITLALTTVPMNDPLALAYQLQGKEGIPQTVAPPLSPLTVGTLQTFWVSNADSNEHFQVSATLRAVGDYMYFWIQDGVSYEQAALDELVKTFEEKIYSNNRRLFGAEWSPGVDGDPHLYILYAKGLGKNLLGYFSSTDEMHPLAHEYSNAHELFLLNADNLDLSEPSTFGVLAHEFQHMIHWNRDRNEESWLNEGASELAAFLNGYDDGSVSLYTRNPDLQLNDWPADASRTGPHYRASFLFMAYFLDRFGEDAVRDLIASPANGLESIDFALGQWVVPDLSSGEPMDADDLFMDWAIANTLQDESLADGRFGYHLLPDFSPPRPTATIEDCPTDTLTRDVHQYGVDYIRITCAGKYTLHFEGSVQVGVLPADAHSGSYAFWSNRGDESDMTLTQAFDFTGLTAPLTLSYWAWYDLESDYDYLYVEVSADGKRWQILPTLSGVSEDPSGNSYGWGYNGKSDGWVKEAVDLSPFAGGKVQVRFQYITDAAVNGEGFLLDDVRIPETGYFTDFEEDAGGWQSNGWARIQNVLPQTYRLALIERGMEPSITYLSLTSDNTAHVPLSLRAGEEVIFLVTATTRYTHQTTGYRFDIRPAPLEDSRDG
jgi:hypothetical protein